MEQMRFFELSELDQLMPRLYVRWLLCFPLSADSPSKERLLDILHSGVLATFQEMPIIGGRLLPRPEDTSRLRVLLPESSMDFHLRAKHHDSPADDTFPTYRQLREANFPVSKLPDGILTPPELPSLPVFDLMATFIRGGLLLCVKCHHSVVDGVGLGLVLKALAWNCFAAASSMPVVRRAPIPSTDRTRLPAAKSERRSGLGFMLQDDIERRSDADTEYAPMTSHIFKFQTPALERLKLLCMAGWTTPEQPSTHDSLTALLFACISYARSLRFSHDSQAGSIRSSVMGIAVNGRSRVNPPMHDYAGNLTVYASFSNPMQLPVEELPPFLMTDTEQLAARLGLAYLSYEAHKSIAAVASPRNDYIASTIGLAQSAADITSLKPSFSNFFQGTDFFISSLAGVDVFQDEWWHGGYVDELRIPLKAHWDGSCGILPTKDRSAGLDVLLGAREDDMEVVKQMLFAFGASITSVDS